VYSRGRQFDRLGSLFFGDVEIWRTSTAEPTQAGIRWTYNKDVSAYLSLFWQPQKVIFDLGNLINEKYTAPFDVKLTVSFFLTSAPAPAADAIIPISARKSAVNQASTFTIPGDRAANAIKFPRNVRRAIATLAATGQGSEEFWYTNLLSSDSRKLRSANEDGPNGQSPFREAQLWIDGALAGVSTPFPIIFTGGISPLLWRPVVGIDAFDLREGEIDITPWLPTLCDGKKGGHEFEIRVVGMDDDGAGNGWLTKSAPGNWVVTGKIFLWLDEPNAITTGSRLEATVPDPTISIHSGWTTTTAADALGGRSDEVLKYGVKVDRSLMLASTVKTAQGSRRVSWLQHIRYNVDGHVSSNSQAVSLDAEESDDSGYHAASFRHTLDVSLVTRPSMAATADKATVLDGAVKRGLSVNLSGQPAIVASRPSYSYAAAPPPPPSIAAKKQQMQRSTAPAFASTFDITEDGQFRMIINPDGRPVSGSATTEQKLAYGGNPTAQRRRGRYSGYASSSAEATGAAAAAAPGFSYRHHVYAINGRLLRSDESLSAPPGFRPISPRVMADEGRPEATMDAGELLGRLPRVMALPLGRVSAAQSLA
jgi:hypothetical protein